MQQEALQLESAAQEISHTAGDIESVVDANTFRSVLLPQETIQAVFAFLPLADVGVISLTCKHWHSAFSDPSWWLQLLLRDYYVVHRAGDYYCLPLEKMSSKEDTMAQGTLLTKFDPNVSAQARAELVKSRRECELSFDCDDSSESLFDYLPSTDPSLNEIVPSLTANKRQQIFVSVRCKIAEEMQFKHVSAGPGGLFFNRTPRDTYGMIQTRTFIEKSFSELTRAQKYGVVGMSIVLSPVLLITHIPDFIGYVADSARSAVGGIKSFTCAVVEFLKRETWLKRKSREIIQALVRAVVALYHSARWGIIHGVIKPMQALYRVIVPPLCTAIKRLAHATWRALAALWSYGKAIIAWVWSRCIVAPTQAMLRCVQFCYRLLCNMLVRGANRAWDCGVCIASAVENAAIRAAAVAKWIGVSSWQNIILPTNTFIRDRMVAPLVSFGNLAARKLHAVLIVPLVEGALWLQSRLTQFLAWAASMIARAGIAFFRGVVEPIGQLLLRVSRALAQLVIDVVFYSIVGAGRALRFIWDFIVVPFCNFVVWTAIRLWRGLSIVASFFYWSILRPMASAVVALCRMVARWVRFIIGWLQSSVIHPVFCASIRCAVAIGSLLKHCALWFRDNAIRPLQRAITRSSVAVWRVVTLVSITVAEFITAFVLRPGRRYVLLGWNATVRASCYSLQVMKAYSIATKATVHAYVWSPSAAAMRAGLRLTREQWTATRRQWSLAYSALVALKSQAASNIRSAWHHFRSKRSKK